MIAWIADGKVWLRDDAGGVAEWTSAFARQVESNTASQQRRNAWKRGGDPGTRFVWGAAVADDLPGAIQRAVPVALTGGRAAGELLYVLQTSRVTALLARTPPPEPAELRLFHSGDVVITDAHAVPDGPIALAVREPTGATHLATLDPSGSRLRTLTDGDSVDACPRWAGPSRLLYHSAGIGRDERGLYVGRAPFALCALDLAQGAIAELATEPDRDLLRPAEAPDGALWYVRRPFEQGRRAPWYQLLLDLLLAPFRLGQAIVGWLDLFTVSYSGKRLLPGAGPEAKSPQERMQLVLGHLVDVERAERESRQAGDPVPARVPQSWELVRRPAGGARPEVVARAVLAYDLGPDGSVVWTNGRAIVLRRPDGATERIAEADRVEALAFVS